MRGEGVNHRVVILALLATVALRLVAWGAPAQDAAHASDLNQTIPTITPTSTRTHTPTPTPTEPAVVPTTEAPTESPGVPTETPTATVSVSPATPSGEPTSGLTTGTATASPSPTPFLAAASDTPARTSDVTVTGQVLATPGPTATSEVLPEGSPLPQPSPKSPVQQATTPLQPAEDSSATTSAGSSCLWIALGLLLVIAGGVLLIRWRRTE